MKICLINTNKYWGGGEKWHLHAAVELEKRGHVITLTVLADSALAKRAGGILKMKEFKVGKLSFLDPFTSARIRRFFKSQKFDAVILNLPADAKAFSKPAFQAGVKKVIYRRGMNHPIKASFVNKYFYKNFITNIIANSEDVKRSVFKNIPELEHKITVIPNGIQIGKRVEHSQARKPKLLIGNLGRLVDQKGQEDLIKLGELLYHAEVDFHVFIGGEGELRYSLEGKIAEASLTDHITLLGEVKPEDFFPMIDYFVFPSRFEGFSNAILESMYFGKPVICYDVASNAEIIQNGKNGFVVEPFAIEELKKKVLELSDDNQLYQSFQEEARTALEAKYDYSKTIDQLESLIKS
ncbi:MAG: glycosyltransferase [Flavobacteriales bacterium]|nr:glycosyltransferase [Flavobacteriales bacterium]